MTEKTGAKPAAQPIRRVVTGQAKDGKSVVASDNLVAPIVVPLMPGAAFFGLWGADAMPALPDSGAEPSYRTWFPPDGGYRFELVLLPPDGTPPSAGIDRSQALAETEALLPGLMAAMDPAHPGWHATDTIDLIYVAKGQCVLKLDGGETVTLRAGDTLVQNGARHAWSNPGGEACALLTVSLGVPRKG
ncbi:MAG: cupin domain-containing protein [Methyloceanibacter sp.]